MYMLQRPASLLGPPHLWDPSRDHVAWYRPPRNMAVVAECGLTSDMRHSYILSMMSLTRILLRMQAFLKRFSRYLRTASVLP